MEEITLESLTKENPDLVKQIQLMALESVKSLHVTTLEALVTDHKKEMDGVKTQLEEATAACQTATDKLVEAEKSDSEKEMQGKIDEAKVEAKAAKEKADADLEEAQKKIAVLEKPAETEKRASAILEACKKPEHKTYCNIMLTQLQGVNEATEISEEVITACATLAESLFKSMGEPEGAGKLPKDGKRGGGQDTTTRDKGGDKGGENVDENLDETTRAKRRQAASPWASLAGVESSVLQPAKSGE